MFLYLMMIVIYLNLLIILHKILLLQSKGDNPRLSDNGTKLSLMFLLHLIEPVRHLWL